jgi:hypothetical protein
LLHQRAPAGLNFGHLPQKKKENPLAAKGKQPREAIHG